MQKLTTKEILRKNLKRKAPESVKKIKIWLHNIRSMHNVGSAFRTADAFGISEVILTGYTPSPPRPEISKTALGADEFVNWVNPADTTEAAASLKKQGYRLVGIEQTVNSRLLTDVSYSGEKSSCFIFGNEVTGIDDDLLLLCDEVVEIPQFGKKHSFNVSVSIGIVLYDALKSSL